jgi:hypothetical protein
LNVCVIPYVDVSVYVYMRQCLKVRITQLHNGCAQLCLMEATDPVRGKQ